MGRGRTISGEGESFQEIQCIFIESQKQLTLQSNRNNGTQALSRISNLQCFMCTKYSFHGGFRGCSKNLWVENYQGIWVRKEMHISLRTLIESRQDPASQKETHIAGKFLHRSICRHLLRKFFSALKCFWVCSGNRKNPFLRFFPSLKMRAFKEREMRPYHIQGLGVMVSKGL